MSLFELDYGIWNVGYRHTINETQLKKLYDVCAFSLVQLLLMHNNRFVKKKQKKEKTKPKKFFFKKKKNTQI